MAEWTRDMVEERIVEAAADSAAAAGPSLAGLLQHLAGDPAHGQGDRRRHAAADAVTAAEQRGDHPNGGGDHLEPLPQPEEAHLMWARAEGMLVEGALLPVRDQPADSEPTVGIRSQRHRLAAERPAGASSTRATFRRGASGMRSGPPSAGKCGHDPCDRGRPRDQVRGPVRCVPRDSRRLALLCWPVAMPRHQTWGNIR